MNIKKEKWLNVTKKKKVRKKQSKKKKSKLFERDKKRT